MPLFGQRSAPLPGWRLVPQRPLNDGLMNSFDSPSWPEYLFALKQIRKNKGVRRGDVPGFVVAKGPPWLQKFFFHVLVWMWANPDKIPKRWFRFIPKEGMASHRCWGFPLWTHDADLGKKA